MLKRLTILTLALAMAFSLAACKKEEGPMEKMGKAMDEAAHDAEDAMKDAGDAVKDAAEDVKEAVEGDG